MSYPQGYYVYVYLDGCDPIYVGAGRRGRAWAHFYPSLLRYSGSPLYPYLQKMLEAGDRPIILIVKEGLTAKEGRASEAALIELIGTLRAGTGTLLNVVNTLRGDYGPQRVFKGWHPIVWGESFETLAAVSRDPRCVVNVATLRTRLAGGQPIGLAVATPAAAKKGTHLVCWGKAYGGWTGLARDPRCVVSVPVVKQRVTKLGWTLERAATTPGATTGKARPVPPTDNNLN